MVPGTCRADPPQWSPRGEEERVTANDVANPLGGSICEIRLKEAGDFPFVKHAFADETKGAVGVLRAEITRKLRVPVEQALRWTTCAANRIGRLSLGRRARQE